MRRVYTSSGGINSFVTTAGSQRRPSHACKCQHTAQNTTAAHTNTTQHDTTRHHATPCHAKRPKTTHPPRQPYLRSRVRGRGFALSVPSRSQQRSQRRDGVQQQVQRKRECKERPPQVSSELDRGKHGRGRGNRRAQAEQAAQSFPQEAETAPEIGRLCLPVCMICPHVKKKKKEKTCVRVFSSVCPYDTSFHQCACVTTIDSAYIHIHMAFLRVCACQCKSESNTEIMHISLLHYLRWRWSRSPVTNRDR